MVVFVCLLLEGHKNWIHCCNFSGCNKWLLSGSKVKVNNLGYVHLVHLIVSILLQEGELRLWSTEHARSYDRKISQHESSTLVEVSNNKVVVFYQGFSSRDNIQFCLYLLSSVMNVA